MHSLMSFSENRACCQRIEKQSIIIAKVMKCRDSYDDLQIDYDLFENEKTSFSLDI